ncbi:hypothetical protein IEQ34_010030 [Dendrobium chrysotoxum]|uniref:Uncharacterized protein n=1 Tax=Dendrobium chrysotoxum TaxID=161865 RepID=A0AAV7H4M3_DENCH|nr:hypothetical protein IEQ34_010030 [Dendrobium chrysotoxum]
MPSPSSFSPKFAFAIAFSFSLALSSSSHSPLPFLPKFPTNLSLELFSSHSSASRHSSPSPPQSIAADLLSLFGSKHDAGQIPQDEARQIRSCLRFLVPPASDSLKGRRKISEKLIRRELDEENEMVWWPPAPVMELARLAVDSGGDPGTIQRALDPTKLLVPDVEGLKKDKCELTRTPNGYRFANKDLNSYFEFLFELIVERAPSVGMNVSLNRYDLFHGHLFLASDSGRLGILFHAREYPAYERKRFPYNLGFCQTGSTVIYDDSMNLRNILWLAPLPSNVTKAWLAPGTLVVLDAHPGGVIYEKLVPDYVDFVRTVYEDDFGEVVVDVNYLNLDNAAPGERIFIC